jgi:hypothetical protein
MVIIPPLSIAKLGKAPYTKSIVYGVTVMKVRVYFTKKVPAQYKLLLKAAVCFAASNTLLPKKITVTGITNDDSLLGLVEETKKGYKISLNFGNLESLDSILGTLFHELKHCSDIHKGVLQCLENGFRYYGVKVPYIIYSMYYKIIPFEITANRFERKMLAKMKEDLR